MAGSDSLKNGEITKPRVGDGTPGPGRPKGALNKTTIIAKDAIATAFDRLGGVDALVTWAGLNDDNKRVFYGTIYPKLLPLQLTGQDGGAIVHEVRRVITDPAHG